MARLDERQIRWLLAGVALGCFVLMLTLEIATDPDHVTFFDGFFDGVQMLLTIGSAVGVALLAQRVQAQREERMGLIDDLRIARAEGEAWRAKVQSSLSGIRAEMENQFGAWGMTAAEREVGLLMLKGLNHREIATLRGTTEATVRQQAQAIYRKAALPGRAAFLAFFLEDLMATGDVVDGVVALADPAASAGPEAGGAVGFPPPPAGSDKR